MYYIGIDLGGTNIKGALVSETGEITREVSRPTRVGLGAEAVCDGIAAVITELSSGVDRTSLGGVGLGCPGTVDDETGRVLYANNLGWKNFDLRAAVKSRTDFDLRIGNDANVAALAEALVGCAKGAQSAVIVTLGTGVGGGVVLDGKMLTGYTGAASELGHMVIRAGGEECTCGRRGCFEAYASATALIRETKRAMATHPESRMHAAAEENGAVDGRTAFIAAQRGDAAAQDGFFTSFITSPVSPIVFMLIFLALTAWVVYCGVEKGIEKYSRYIMPGLLLLIIGIAIFSLTLSYTDESGMTRTGIEGLLVYIKPDFTGLTVQRFLNIALDAMSQLFFSLSVSMGIMVAYGSYVKKETNLMKSINQIEIFDTGVAFLAGLMIIPAVYVFLGTDGMASGPSLTFISLPKVFAAMGGVGRVVGAVFFLALGFAALTSCVSVMETLVANCMEIFHKSRKEMCAAVGVYSLVTAVLICLGYNALYFELPLPNGSTAQLLDVMDYISNSFLMPFISLLTSILVGWVVGPKWIIAEVEKNGEHFGRAKLYSVMMKYVVPVVMLILFLTSTGLGSLIFGGR